MNLTKTKDLLDITQKVVTIAAIIIGGIWTYTLFIQHRSGIPKGNIRHHVTGIKLLDDHTLLSINISIENTGNVKFSLAKGIVRIEEVLPLDQYIVEEIKSKGVLVKADKDNFDWNQIRSRHSTWEKDETRIEPGETANFYYEFVIPQKHEVVLVYTWFTHRQKDQGFTSWFTGRTKNVSGAKLGWTKSTFYDTRNIGGD